MSLDLRNVVPMVIETSARGERAFDIYSLLLRERIIFLGTPIDDQIANLIVAQLLYLDREDPERDINMYIHSPGGVITAGLAILDTMRMIRPDVSTIAVGMTASMGTVLLTAGTKGKRYALPHATIHMHQALGGTQGQVTDMEIAVKEAKRLNQIVREVLQTGSGQSMEKIERDTDRDYYLDAAQAVEYGLIDQILTPAAQAAAASN